ncbi:MAG: hypothetical protein OXC40_03060 [Proteobacteria bacterium]|nr:hypothetical protein [Pseudomonadota bacterium]
MFTRQDFSLKNTEHVWQFIFIIPFVLLIMPFLMIAYHIGLFLDLTEKLDDT